MIAPEVVAFATEPVFIAVAFADAELRPTLLRGASLAFEGDRARIVCGYSTNLGSGPEALAARMVGQRAAFVVSSPSRVASFQLKGRVVEACVATEAEVAEGRRRLGLLGEEVERVQGVPAALYQRFPFLEGVRLSIEVSEAYDQTPGASAGRRLA